MGFAPAASSPLRASYTDGHDSYTTSSVADINDGGGGVVTDEREEEWKKEEEEKKTKLVLILLYVSFA